MTDQPTRPALHADYWDVAKVTALVIHEQHAAASFIMRRTGMNFTRTNQVLDLMEAWGYVGPAHGSFARDVLKARSELGDALVELEAEWQSSTGWLRAAVEEADR